jgi:hypothetical protein
MQTKKNEEISVNTILKKMIEEFRSDNYARVGVSTTHLGQKSY